MLSLLSQPENGPLESWNLAQWNQALFVHFFVSPQTPRCINRLHVTAEELRTASGATAFGWDRI
jgi:hypothetical protein